MWTTHAHYFCACAKLIWPNKGKCVRAMHAKRWRTTFLWVNWPEGCSGPRRDPPSGICHSLGIHSFRSHSKNSRCFPSTRHNTENEFTWSHTLKYNGIICTCTVVYVTYHFEGHFALVNLRHRSRLQFVDGLAEVDSILERLVESFRVGL